MTSLLGTEKPQNFFYSVGSLHLLHRGQKTKRKVRKEGSVIAEGRGKGWSQVGRQGRRLALLQYILTTLGLWCVALLSHCS